ncbi:MAG: gliding motility-associated C-terminal domain-containing protein [Cytophagaceae bacterium]|nr:gliding motility-associated C-terminal domain-containing protein [Cytophagaceae bacterium]
MRSTLLFRFLLLLLVLMNITPSIASDEPTFDKLPFRFRENKGQWAEHVRYGAWSGSANVYFLKQGLSITHWRGDKKQKEYLTWNVNFVHANANSILVTSDHQASQTQYFKADKTILIDKEYALLRYNNLYNNIDLQYYGYENTLKYDYILHPGADVNNIQMKADGIKKYEIVNGELIVHHAWGTVKENKPYSYQIIDGKQKEVKVRFKLIDKLTYGFEIYGAYDPSINLIIDPIKLVWGTYVGSGNASSQGYMYDIATDKEGHVYGTGYYQASFPTTAGSYQQTYKGGDINGSNGDAFVFKLNRDGSKLLFSSYIGGIRDEEGYGIWWTKNGRVYVTGNTNSTDFPVSTNAYQKVRKGLKDCFIACFDSQQGTLLSSTYIGGLDDDKFNDVKVDEFGNVWVGGETRSFDFPVLSPTIKPTFQGGTFDGIISKFSADLSQLKYSSYIGGTGDDKITALAYFQNTITFVGYSGSPDFGVTTNAYQTQNKGGTDAIAGRISTATNALEYATFIGGAYDDIANDLDCNASGSSFITGYTMSADYPNTAGIPLKGLKDVFITALASDGKSLVFSRLIGGKRNDEGTSIVVNGQNQSFVVGSTVSPDFPLNQANATDQGLQVFLLSLDYTGNFLGYSMMIGGSKDDSEVPRIALPTKEVLCEVVVGFSSHSMNLNTTAGAYQPSKLNGGERNAQPALFKYYFGPNLPFCSAPDHNDNYICETCLPKCPTKYFTVCPGIIPVPVPERPANDTAYFYPWVYTILQPYNHTPTVFTQSPVSIVFDGGHQTDTIQISDGCSILKIPVDLTQPPVSLEVAAPSTVLCSNDPQAEITLTAIALNFGKILWSTGDTTASITVTSAGTYSVTATLGICGETMTRSITVTNGNPPGNPFGANSQLTYCFPGSYVLTGITATDNIPLTDYKWTPGGETTRNITITQGGTYCLSKINVCGNVSSCIQVNEIRKPAINLGKDTVLCQGQTLQLTVPIAYQQFPFVWSTAATTTSITALPGNTYWLKVTNACGTGGDTIVVGVSPDKPVVNLGPDLVKCGALDFPITLDAGFANASFLWNTGQTTKIIQVTQGGNYWVHVSNGCGFDNDTINILSNPLLNVSLGPDRRGCSPAVFNLDPGNFGTGTTYSWSTGATTQSINATQTGTYTVTVTNTCGSASASVNVKIDQGLPAFTLGPDFFICPGASKTLSTTTNGTSYLWNDGSTLSSLIINGPGLYWLEITNSCGVKRDSVIATTQPALYTNLPADTSMCDPNVLFLSVPAQNCTYSWNTGSTNRSIIVTGSGLYTVTLTNACQTISASINVIYSTSKPTVDLGPDLIRCGAAPIRDTLRAGNAYRYLWNTNAITDTIIVTSPGLYSVRISNACGYDTDSLIVIGDPVKTGLNDVSFCNTSPVILDAGNAGATYLWTPGNQSTQTISVSQTGQYIIAISNVCGTIKDTIVVSLETQPPVVDLGPDVRICSPATQLLDATVTGATYLWSTGSTTPTLTVSIAGAYKVTVTNACGVTTDSLDLLVDTGVPNVDLGPDTMVCNPVVVAMDAGNPGAASYLWTPGNVTTQELIAFSQGTYEVTVTNACGTDMDDLIISGYSQPSIHVKDTASCNTPITFDVTSAPATYEWNPGSITSPIFTVTTSGTYRINLHGHPCGVITATAHVIINTGVPVIDLGADTSLCTPAGYTLDAGTYEGGHTLWLPSGSTDRYLPVNQAGTYTLQVTNYCGMSQDQLILGANHIQFPVRPDTTVCAFSEVTIRTPLLPGYSYEWYTFKDPTTAISTADTASVHPSYPYSDYVAKVFDGPCYNLDSVRVNVYKEVDPKIVAEDFEGYIPLGLHFNDDHHSGTIYNWTFDDGGTSADPTPYHVFQDERYYTVSVHVENNAGCFGDDTLKVRAFDIFIPNLITVNGDNMNDNWDLTNLNPYIHVEIYNSWGDKVYEKDNYVDEWHGQDVNNGIYYFFVRDTKYKKEFKGWVHLIK